MEPVQTTAPVAAAEPIQITISGVKQDLSNGLDRKAIKEKYGLSNADLKNLFQHPKLKGLKVKDPAAKAPKFTLIDDEPEKPIKAKKAITEEVKSEVEALEAEKERVIETAPTVDAAPATAPVETAFPNSLDNVVTQAPVQKEEPVRVIPKSEW